MIRKSVKLIHEGRYAAEVPVELIEDETGWSPYLSVSDALKLVDAPLAVIPVGYRNRFRHPRPEVLARYTEPGHSVLRTDADGAVTLRLTREGVASARERQVQDRYWRGR
jgi:competence protein ComEC